MVNFDYLDQRKGAEVDILGIRTVGDALNIHRRSRPSLLSSRTKWGCVLILNTTNNTIYMQSLPEHKMQTRVFPCVFPCYPAEAKLHYFLLKIGSEALTGGAYAYPSCS
jgi:hypothetical protein